MTQIHPADPVPTSNMPYYVEYKNSLTAANWTTLQMIVGNGDVMTINDTNAVMASRFYRLRLPFP